MFSTHSPYLLNPDRLDRIRLVIRRANKLDGTRIEKIHANADAETLTPIMTAIGLDVAKHLGPAATKNVITEGISDYYYLQAVRQILGDQLQGASVIGCVGATRVPQMVSLLMGWGLDYVAVLDSDREGANVARELLTNLLAPERKVVMIADQHNTSIEDLFSADDFQRLVLDNVGAVAPPADRNSARISGLDKPLLAKSFFDLARKGSVQISQETRQSFEQLLARINQGFGDESARSALVGLGGGA